MFSSVSLRCKVFRRSLWSAAKSRRMFLSIDQVQCIYLKCYKNWNITTQDSRTGFKLPLCFLANCSIHAPSPTKTSLVLLLLWWLQSGKKFYIHIYNAFPYHTDTLSKQGWKKNRESTSPQKHKDRRNSWATDYKVSWRVDKQAVRQKQTNRLTESHRKAGTQQKGKETGLHR